MILLVASCYENRDKLRLDEPLSSSADSTYLFIKITIEANINFS